MSSQGLKDLPNVAEGVVAFQGTLGGLAGRHDHRQDYVAVAFALGFGALPDRLPARRLSGTCAAVERGSRRGRAHQSPSVRQRALEST